MLCFVEEFFEMKLFEILTDCRANSNRQNLPDKKTYYVPYVRLQGRHNKNGTVEPSKNGKVSCGRKSML